MVIVPRVVRCDVEVGPDEDVEPDEDDVPDEGDVLDEEVVPDPESVDGAAAAKPLPKPRAAKPRRPAIALVTASFLMVLMVVMKKRYGRGPDHGIGRKMRLDEPRWCKRCMRSER
jgi:hypothetical protein